MTTRIQMRRSTAAVATSDNAVLAAGEWGFETDTHKLKIGDGVTAWVSLPYSVVPNPSGTFVAQTSAQSGATEKRMFTVTTDATVPVSFAASVAQATFNGTAEAIFNHGFNVAAGTLIDATKPGFHVGLEYDYNDGAAHKAEWYVQWSKATSGYFYRPFAFQLDKSSFVVNIEMNVGTSAGTFKLSYGDSSGATTQWLNFSPTGGSTLTSRLTIVGGDPVIEAGDGATAGDAVFGVNAASASAAQFSWSKGSVEKWRLYEPASNTSLFLRDTTNSVFLLQCWAGSASTALFNVLVDGQFNRGCGFFAHTAPTSQPAAPVTLADVIAIIRGCGLSA